MKRNIFTFGVAFVMIAAMFTGRRHVPPGATPQTAAFASTYLAFGLQAIAAAIVWTAIVLLRH